MELERWQRTLDRWLRSQKASQERHTHTNQNSNSNSIELTTYQELNEEEENRELTQEELAILK